MLPQAASCGCKAQSKGAILTRTVTDCLLAASRAATLVSSDPIVDPCNPMVVGRAQIPLLATLPVT